MTGRPVLLVLAAIVSVQVGAAFAKGLFEQVSPLSMAWLRLTMAALMLLVIARPRLTGRSRTDWLLVLGYSVCLVTMNVAIYHSFARIPLGLAVTIEFLGPLTVALLGSRRMRDLVWVVLAGGGVVLLGWSPTVLDPVGVLLALLAGASWAGYIILSGPTGARWSGASAVTMASIFGAVVLAVPAVWVDGAGLVDVRLLAMAALVGLLSSVLPYSLEIAALQKLRAGVFGILMSLEPAAAALAALVLLGEILTGREWLAVVCVVVASVGATRQGVRRLGRVEGGSVG
ncbi:EamA family transporter [Enemella sp. A6]|uniref:EamA family transporter n=1 Tax=Enemella sp. A6 TaxID=3440152 RepID=UPI003EB932C4